jgi:RNA polymerase sigma-70 factor (ECF subfamily)
METESSAPFDFESLVREYTGRLLVVARRILRSDADAADAVQDAFLSAFASRHSFHGGSTPFTWLYRIVVNACLMRLRAQRNAIHVSLEELLPAFVSHGLLREATLQWTEKPQDRLEREEMRSAVRACIDQLPDDYRTVLLLRDIEELDTEKTARILGLSVAAVKTRLHRARQALRTVLERQLAIAA